MKNHTKRFFAALCCLTLCAGSTLPAYAAEETEDDAVYIETTCPGFAPLGEDAFVFSGLYNNKVHVEIVQHSPERENLELYNTTLDSDMTKLYVFRAEPGDYTVTISTPGVFGGNPDCIYTQDVKIENPDYSTGEDAFTATRYAFFGKYLAAADTDENKAVKLLEEPVLRSKSETKKGIACSVGFTRFNRLRGDFNADGIVDLSDAQLTLSDYSKSLSGKAQEATAAQRSACDISGDGKLDVADAQSILMFYSATIANKVPHWPDGTTNAAYDKKFADRSAVYPGDVYPVQMKLVPYFSDEVPAAEADRKAQIDAAAKLLTKEVTLDLGVSGPEYAFLVNGEQTKQLALKFAPELGASAKFDLFNSAKEYPELFEMHTPVSTDFTGIGTDAIKTTLRCNIFRFDLETDPAYFTAAYAEFNVNTGKWKVWNSTRTESLPDFNISYK